MLRESEQETKRPLELDFKYIDREEKEKIIKEIKKEKDMKAKEITIILENYLKKEGFITVKEK